MPQPIAIKISAHNSKEWLYQLAVDRRNEFAGQSSLAPASTTPQNRTAMASHGAALQTHNNELVKCIEELREKREEISKLVRVEEAGKLQIQQDLQVLTKRLRQIDDSLLQKVAKRDEVDKLIRETEMAYLKILESSHTLLTVLKRESISMQQRQSIC